MIEPTATPVPSPSPRGDAGPVITLKSGLSTHVVLRSDIAAIVASENYCRVLFIGRRPLRVRGTLQAWVALLPAGEFMRVHRTAIVNLGAITRIVPRDREVVLVSVLGARTPLRARRTLRRELEARLAGHSGHRES